MSDASLKTPELEAARNDAEQALSLFVSTYNDVLVEPLSIICRELETGYRSAFEQVVGNARMTMALMEELDEKQSTLFEVSEQLFEKLG